MPRTIVRQVILCPVCGISSKLERFHINTYGNAIPGAEPWVPVLRVQYSGKGQQGVAWATHDLPVHVLRALILQTREALAAMENQLAEMPDEE
jgi:hypothetical protein